MERTSQPLQRKTMVDLLDQKITRKIQLQIMLSKKAMYLQIREQLLKQHTRTLCITLDVKTLTKYTLDKYRSIQTVQTTYA